MRTIAALSIAAALALPGIAGATMPIDAAPGGEWVNPDRALMGQWVNPDRLMPPVIIAVMGDADQVAAASLIPEAKQACEDAASNDRSYRDSLYLECLRVKLNPHGILVVDARKRESLPVSFSDR